MMLTIKYHAGNPNMCRIPELKIRPMPECEGGGWWMPREQAELIVAQAETIAKMREASEANAQLIAAANRIIAEQEAFGLMREELKHLRTINADILAALEILTGCHSDGGYVQPNPDVLQIARAAIAKAGGRS